MRDLAILLVHPLATIAKLMGPGGARAAVAESLLMRHQLRILSRARKRAPGLHPMDRVTAGLCTLNPRFCEGNKLGDRNQACEEHERNQIQHSASEKRLTVLECFS